jgi:hypothetical protein
MLYQTMLYYVILCYTMLSNSFSESQGTYDGCSVVVAEYSIV